MKINLYRGQHLAILSDLISKGERWDYCLTQPYPYTHDLEPWDYITHLSKVFQLVYNGLTHDGECWIVIGDATQAPPVRLRQPPTPAEPLCLPWMLAQLLRQRNGYHLRAILIWNCPPKHEYILHLAKHHPSKGPEFSAQPLKSTVLHHRVKRTVEDMPPTLPRDLLSTITKPEPVVIDPFIRSGATAIACQELEYWCIGIDEDTTQAEAATAQLSIF